MKPRILIFSLAYEPLVGGAEVAVRSLTDRLFDYEFDMITCRFDDSHQAQERIGHINVYRVGFGNRLGRYLYPWFAYHKAVALHKQNPYQLTWSIMAAYAGAAGLLFIWRFPKIKFLLTLQEGDPIKHIRKQVRGFATAWRLVFRHADYIQTISKFLADWAREEGATAPVEVVPNGVDLEKFSARGGSASGGKIVTVSRLVPKNGVDILIRAFSVIASEAKQSRDRHGEGSPRDVKEVKLQILGVGPDEAKLKNLVKELGLQDRVEFIGVQTPEKVAEYLSHADIFVRPSRSEGLGNAFLEAMAAGLPVIGTPVGGIPDFLQDRETGLFCEPENPRDLAEKIKLLLENEDLRQKLAKNGRQLIEETYDWNKIALRFHNIIRNLTLSPSPTSPASPKTRVEAGERDGVTTLPMSNV